MAKKSSLFKVMTSIIAATALTLSVATGMVIANAFQRYNKASQKDNYKPKGIKSIDKTGTYGLIDEYTITYSDDTTSTFIVTNGANGEQGIQGFPGNDGHTPTIVIGSNGTWVIDGVDSGVKAQGPKGEDGRGIESIEKTDSTGNVDTYTITYTDGTTSQFIVVNGVDGAQGLPGPNGRTPVVTIGANGHWFIDGEDSGVDARGQNGRGIQSIEKTATDGLIDTYTITYTDGTTSTFVVVNGAQGATGAQGIQGPDGHTPVITIGENGNWFVDGDDTGVAARGEQGEQGQPGVNGNSVITGTGAPLSSLGRDGDTYIDVDSWNLYVKENGIWVVKGNIRGAAGEAGVAGSNGTSVLVGNSDPANTLGQNGDSYINLLTWDFFVKENDAWVNKGNIKGANGAAGASGNSLLTGTGAPSNDDGQNGDTYIDYATYDIYSKSEGSWTKTGNIKGANGVSIVSVEKTSTSGNVDTYTIRFSDGSSTTFTVTNGINGHTPEITIGDNGNWFIDGVDTGRPAGGAAGAAGKGIANIELINSEGVVDTYRITFTDNTTFTYTVTNGADGQDGTSVRTGNGAPNNALGQNGDSYIDLDTFDYYVKEEGAWVLKGNIKGANGATGANGSSVLTGNGAPDADLGNQGDSYIDTDTWNFYVKTGSGWGSAIGNIKGPGLSVVSVELTSTSGNVDTYTITFSDNTTATFTVTNGTNGATGANGKTLLTGTGAPAEDLGSEGDSYIDVTNWKLYVKGSTSWEDKGTFKGSDGVSIVSIALTSSSGNIDTYTITFSNSTSTTFTVTNGINGNTLITGSVDPTTEGVDGDSYLNTSTWEYFVKESGTWVSKGHINGADGANGQDGTSVTTGNGVPDDDDGINGDSYIDLATWNFYVKEGDTWVQHGNIHNELDTYTITFDTDEGSTNPENQEVEHGFKVTEPTDPTKEGWIFQGWFTPDGQKWNFTKDVVTEDVTLIAHWAKFKVVDGYVVECTATGDVTIPEIFNGQTVIGIGEEVFKNKTNITSVTFPYTLIRICDSAFEGCTGLQSVIIPGNIKEIQQEAFKDCANIAYVYFDNGLEVIGDNAFAGCTEMKALMLPASIKSIGQGAFAGATKGWTAFMNLKEMFSPNAEHIYVTSETPNPSNKSDGDIMFEDGLGTFSVYSEADQAWYSQNLQLQVVMDIAYGSGLPDFNTKDVNSLYLDKDTGIIYVNCINKLESVSLSFVGGSTTDNTYLGYIFGADSLDDNGSYVPFSIKTLIINGDNKVYSKAMYNCASLENVIFTGDPEGIGAGAFDGCLNLRIMTLPYIGCDAGGSKILTGTTAPSDSLAGSMYINTSDHKLYTKLDGVWTLYVDMAEAMGTSDFEYGHGEPTASSGVIYIDLDSGNLYTFTGNWTLAGNISTGAPGGHNMNAIFTADPSNMYPLPYCLEKVILTNGNGENRDEIPDYAFYGSDIKEVVFSANIRVIGEGAFKECYYLEHFIVPNSVQVIKNSAFAQCYSLESITLSSSLTEISESCFEDCYDLVSIIIPNNVTKIGKKAFSDCHDLTYVYLPNGLLTIGEEAFGGCSYLASIVVPDTVTSIGLGAFKSCYRLETMTLPFVGSDPIGGINAYDQLFAWIFGLSYGNVKTLVLTSANGVNRDALPANTFAGFTHLETVILPNNLKSIGTNAFSQSGIKSMIIPGSVTDVGEKAFYRSGLTDIIFEEGNPITFGYQAFAGCQNLDSVVIKGEIVGMNLQPFAGCINLRVVSLGYGLREVSDHMFDGLSNLTTVILPNTVQTIGFSAFANCTSLRNIIIPEGVTLIDNQAFYQCTSLTRIVIPNSVATIGNHAFRNCTSLANVVLSEGLVTIGQHCFDSAIIESIIIPHSVKTIKLRAFANCSNLKYAFMSEGLEVIGDHAFLNCALTSIVFPDTLKYIGKGALAGCSIKSLTTPFTGGISYASGTVHSGGVADELPDNDIGDDGDLFVDVVNKKIFYKANGEWYDAFVLARSDNDVIGTIQAGTANPEFDDVPFTTDFYVDLNEGCYYELNAAGTEWVYIASLFDVLTKVGYTFVDPNGGYKLGQFNLILSNTFTSIRVTRGTYFEYVGGYMIWNRSFDKCQYLTSVSIGKNIKYISTYAFNECQALQEVAFDSESSLEQIDSYAFNSCGSLVSVSIPGSVIEISSFAFNDCSSLTYVMFEKYNGLESKLETIGYGAFTNCTSLVAITIPSNVSLIAGLAFENCTSLKTFVIAEGGLASSNVYLYGEDILHGCTAIETLVVPFLPNKGHDWSVRYQNFDPSTEDDLYVLNTVTGDLFYKNNGSWQRLVNVKTSSSSNIFIDTNEPSTANVGDVWFYYDYYRFKVKEATGWVEYDFTFRSVDCFFNSAQAGTGNMGATPMTLKHVTINGTLYNHNAYSFYYCMSLESITLPAKTKYIGVSAFQFCSLVKTVDIGTDFMDLMTSETMFYVIDDYAFNYCSYLDSFVGNLIMARKIGAGAFAGCGIRALQLRTESIGERAFSESLLNEITIIPLSEEYDIGDYGFYGCASLKHVYIEYGLTSIGEHAFEDCPQLISIIIPRTNTYIGEAAFENDYALTTCYFKGTSNEYAIKEDTFANCYSLTSIVIDNASRIEAEAFSGCRSLTYVSLGYHCSHVDDYAFSGCYALTTVNFQCMDMTFGDNVFSWCYSLSTIVYDLQPGYTYNYFMSNFYVNFSSSDKAMLNGLKIICADQTTTINHA